jgi:ABC-type amino acid transport substrate-binding protein
MIPTREIGGRCRRAVGTAAMVLLVPLALSACGGGDEDSSAASTAENEEIAALVPEAIAERGTLRVAVPDGSAPLASVNDAGEAEGMDVDMANAIGGLMGLDVEITAGTFDSQIPGLQSGKFDIAMGEYYITPERLESVDFVSAWRDYSSFATRKDDTFEPQTAQELCGRTVGVMKGSAEEASVTDFNDAECDDPMEVASFPDQAASFLALDSERIDAVVTGRGPLEAAAASNDTFKISGEMGGGPTAIAVARNESTEEMLEALTAAVDELIADGTYEEILTEWKTDYGAVDKATVYTQDSTPPDYS